MNLKKKSFFILNLFVLVVSCYYIILFSKYCKLTSFLNRYYLTKDIFNFQFPWFTFFFKDISLSFSLSSSKLFILIFLSFYVFIFNFYNYIFKKEISLNIFILYFFASLLLFSNNLLLIYIFSFLLTLLLTKDFLKKNLLLRNFLDCLFLFAASVILLKYNTLEITSLSKLVLIKKNFLPFYVVLLIFSYFVFKAFVSFEFSLIYLFFIFSFSFLKTPFLVRTLFLVLGSLILLTLLYFLLKQKLYCEDLKRKEDLFFASCLSLSLIPLFFLNQTLFSLLYLLFNSFYISLGTIFLKDFYNVKNKKLTFLEPLFLAFSFSFISVSSFVFLLIFNKVTFYFGISFVLFIAIFFLSSFVILNFAFLQLFNKLNTFFKEKKRFSYFCIPCSFWLPFLKIYFLFSFFVSFKTLFTYRSWLFLGIFLCCFFTAYFFAKKNFEKNTCEFKSIFEKNFIKNFNFKVLKFVDLKSLFCYLNKTLFSRSKKIGYFFLHKSNSLLLFLYRSNLHTYLLVIMVVFLVIVFFLVSRRLFI